VQLQGQNPCSCTACQLFQCITKPCAEVPAFTDKPVIKTRKMEKKREQNRIKKSTHTGNQEIEQNLKNEQ
jgi:hypothetical protein